MTKKGRIIKDIARARFEVWNVRAGAMHTVIAIENALKNITEVFYKYGGTEQEYENYQDEFLGINGTHLPVNVLRFPEKIIKEEAE
jgi:hypothetical protein